MVVRSMAKKRSPLSLLRFISSVLFIVLHMEVTFSAYAILESQAGPRTQWSLTPSQIIAMSDH